MWAMPVGLFGGGSVLPVTIDGASGNAVAGSTYLYTVIANIPVGALCVVFGGSGAVTLSSVADTRSNTWAVDKTLAGSNTGAHIASTKIGTQINAGDTITLTFSGSTSSHAAIVCYVTGQAASTPLDKVINASGTSNSPSATTAATTVATEVVFGCFSINDGTRTVTEDSNFSTVGDTQYSGTGRRLHAGYRVVLATGAQTYAPSLSGSAEWNEVMATYKGA